MAADRDTALVSILEAIELGVAEGKKERVRERERYVGVCKMTAFAQITVTLYDTGRRFTLDWRGFPP